MAGGRSVLIAEDDPDVAESLRDLILGAFPGWRVEHALDGDEALWIARRLSAKPFDVVIADHHLGAMSGLDLLVVLQREGKALHKILISGDATVEEYLRESRKDFQFLLKPMEPKALLSLLARFPAPAA